MKSIINYFIKYPIAANMIMVGLFALGVAGFSTMQSTFFPEVESRVISIRLIYPGASPEEVEEGVINKIEENLKGLTGIERVTSVSSENAGSVTVEVMKGYKPDIIVQDVKNAVDRINSFPVGLEPPVVYKLENLGFAISFALSGNVDLATLKMYGRRVEDELLKNEKISKVELSGFPDEEIEIAFREKDLQAYNLTFQQAAQAVRGANLDITGGTLKTQEEELLIRARNKEYYADGFRNIVIKSTPDGGAVYLHQVADIADKWAENPNRSFLNKKPSVIVTVSNTLEEDMLTITDEVNAYIEKFNAKNTDVKATVVRDGSIILRQRMQLLTENGIIGFCIVVFSLALFLHWRIAFWVALSIPISFAGMFLVANYLGVTINVISLFGMIVVIGILVDDGIVIAENIYQRFEKGETAHKAALEGTLQVLPSVFSAVATTVVAFSMFFFLDGRIGDIFQQMAIVVIFSLVFSLVEGAFLLPAHMAHSKALQAGAKESKFQLFFERIMGFFRDKAYAPVLALALRNKFVTVAICVGLLVMTFGAMGGGIIKGTFFPVIERDDINITIQMPSGTREVVTEKWLSHLEDAAWRANDKISKKYFNNEKQALLRIQKSVGPTTFQGRIDIALLDGESRDPLTVREVINAIREEAGEMQEAEAVSYGMQTAFGKPVSVSLVGNNYKELSAATDALKNELNSLTELSDVVDNNQEGLREISISLKEKALYLGLNTQDVLAQVRAGFFGSEVQRLQRGRDEVRVWVRYSESDRSNSTKLEQMRIRLADGKSIPLSEIATLSTQRGVIAINHIDGKREVKVEADIANNNVSVSDLTSAIKTEIVPRVLVGYPSVSALFEGQNREQEKTSASVGRVGIIVLAVMFLIVALAFRSIGQTAMVFMLIPFGFIGVGWGHWLMQAPISMFSILGVIALVGILVNDSLVLVSTYNRYLEEGMDQGTAIYQAGVTRFRPIVLTSVTTFAGLAPLMLEKSLQAQFLIPMAISVSFGLLVVTVLNLLLLPVLIVVVNRFKVYAAYAWNGQKPALEEVEPPFRKEKGYEFLWYVVLATGVLVAIIGALWMK